MIISYNKGRGNKIHLLIDGEYKITTDADFWADNFIKDGTEISEDEWQELVENINYRKAVKKSFDFLLRRDHSVKELKTKLLRTVDEATADKAIDRMLELGYLDDVKYAESLVDYLVNKKKMSAAFVKKEMHKRGIPYEIINSTLEEVEFDNVSSIKEIIEKKYLMKLEAENGKEKVIAALTRKGFSYGDIKTALREMELD